MTSQLRSIVYSDLTEKENIKCSASTENMLAFFFIKQRFSLSKRWFVGIVLNPVIFHILLACKIKCKF